MPHRPFRAGAPEQIQQNRLHLVVGMVGGGDDTALRHQKFIPQDSGGLFRAFARQLPGISPANNQRYIPLGAKLPDKGFISIGLFTPQAMVEVGGRQGDAQLLPQRAQAVEQGNGITAAGQGADHMVTGLQFPAAYRQNLSPHRVSTPGRQRW